MHYLNELEKINLNIREIACEFLSPITHVNKNILYCSLQEYNRGIDSGIHCFDRISFTPDFGSFESVRHIFSSFEYTNSEEKDSISGTYINTDWIKLVHSKIKEVNPKLAQNYLKDAREFIIEDIKNQQKLADELCDKKITEAKEIFDKTVEAAKNEKNETVKSLASNLVRFDKEFNLDNCKEDNKTSDIDTPTVNEETPSDFTDYNSESSL